MEPVSVVRGYSMGSGASKTVDGSGKKSSSRSRKSGPAYYNPATFTITAYLPYDGGKRLKVSIALIYANSSGTPSCREVLHAVYIETAHALKTTNATMNL